MLLFLPEGIKELAELRNFIIQTGIERYDEESPKFSNGIFQIKKEESLIGV